MLSKENNELITRVGPGTPMGNLMRQYWVPALLSSELPKPDCDPVRVMLLGEKLVAFRDSTGHVGLLQSHCPHRGASLFYGRNGECGLRCVYHGWKFDVDGNCTDMPNDPVGDFKHKLKATAYPCVERAGLVWAYMGPRETPPPLPDLGIFQIPVDEVQITPTFMECNWLQAVEGEMDTSHAGFLHLGSVEAEDAPEGSYLHYMLKDRAPRYAVMDTDYGVIYGAYRPAQTGHFYWRIANFMFPFYTQTPNSSLDTEEHNMLINLNVPMDDNHTMSINLMQKLKREEGHLPRSDKQGFIDKLPLFDIPKLPNTSDWFGRFRPVPNAGNDYEIDRERQRNGNEYSGIKYLYTQDVAMFESMGPLFDRSQEHLATSDVAVIQLRRRLTSAVKALSEQGIVPPGVDSPKVYRNRMGEIILPEDADWLEATKDYRKV